MGNCPVMARVKDVKDESPAGVLAGGVGWSEGLGAGDGCSLVVGPQPGLEIIPRVRSRSP